MFLIRQEPLNIEDDQFVYFDEKNIIQLFTGLNGKISNMENINRYVLNAEDGIDLILDFASNGEYIYFIYDSSREDSVKGKIRKILDDRENERSGWENLNNQGLWLRVYHNDDEFSEISLSVEYSLIFSTPNKLTNDEILKFLNEVDLKKGVPSINYMNSVNKMSFIAQTTWWDHFAGIEDNDLHVLIMYTLKRLMDKYTCPCCGFKTFSEPNGIYEICLVCSWQDDGVMNDNPDYWGGANKVTLRQAQRNYIEFGASEKRFIGKLVRECYEKDPLWKPVWEKETKK